MKDDEYFGFSTAGNYKAVDLPDDGTEDDFKIVDLLDFDSENDVRIVNLSDVSNLRNVEDEENMGRNWLDQIDRFDRKAPSLQSYSALKSRCTHRRQVVRSAVVTVLVVTVMLVFVGNFLWIHGIGSTGVQSTTTSASVPVSSNPLYGGTYHVGASDYRCQSLLYRVESTLDADFDRWTCTTARPNTRC